MSPIDITVVACALIAGAALAAAGRAYGQIVRLRHQLTAAEFDARHDPLTGLFNRRALYTTIAEAIDTGRPLSMVMFDVDRFKDVNDLYGHAAGDAVLAEIGRRITGAGVAFRLGGDEFALTVTGDGTDAAKQVWRLIAGDAFHLPQGGFIDVYISVGVAAWRPGDTAGALARHADTALAVAKHAGTVVTWQPDLPTTPSAARPRIRQRDFHPTRTAATIPAATAGDREWSCWFDAADLAPLARHSAASVNHLRNAGEDHLMQDCPGGLAIVADCGYVTAYSTGHPQPAESYPGGTGHDGVAAHTSEPVPGSDTEVQVAHIHLDDAAIDAIELAAIWDRLIAVTVRGAHATFTLVHR